MIVDNIKNAESYYILGERIRKALEFLKNSDFSCMSTGKYEIDGKNVFASLNKYQGRSLADAKWEAHRKYIDIQYVVSGSELMGYAHIDKLKAICDYNEKDDYVLLEGKGSFLEADAGTFFILCPEDAHMPSIVDKISGDIVKFVVKVAI